MTKIKFKKLIPDAVAPARYSDGAAGFDLCAAEDATIQNINVQAQAYVVGTGVAIAIPEGYHGKVFLRSSTGLNTKLRLANGVGIIDSDYRGEVKLLLENNSRTPMHIAKGDRIAQILIERNEDVEFTEAKDLSETKRGKGGLGSTNSRKKVGKYDKE